MSPLLIVREFPHRTLWGPTPKMYRFRGQYLTVAQIAALTGRSKTYVREHIRGDAVIEYESRRGPPPKTYQFRGQTVTIYEAMAMTGRSRSCLLRRVSGNRILEEDDPDRIAWRTPPGRARLIGIGAEVHTLSAWGRKVGLDPSTISRRLAKGWSPSKAIHTPAVYNGKKRGSHV